MINKEKVYKLNENRFNEKALKADGTLFDNLISLGYGNFVRLHCEDWASIFSIDCCDYEMTEILVHRSLLNNDRLEEVRGLWTQ